MSSMVERIARVLCVKDGGDPDEMQIGVGGRPWAGWEAFASIAVDVLGAMREPTEVMVVEGWKQSPQIGSAYTAMIEASIEEGRTTNSDRQIVGAPRRPRPSDSPSDPSERCLDG